MISAWWLLLLIPAMALGTFIGFIWLDRIMFASVRCMKR